MSSDLLVTEQAAKFLEVVSPRTLEKWRSMQSHPLKYYKIGGRVFYKPTDLAEFREKCLKPGTGPELPERRTRSISKKARPRGQKRS